MKATTDERWRKRARKKEQRRSGGEQEKVKRGKGHRLVTSEQDIHHFGSAWYYHSSLASVQSRDHILSFFFLACYF